MVFVIDVSGSTRGDFIGSPVGNPNNDSTENSFLDGEIAGFIALNQQLIKQGLGDIDVGVVEFSGSAERLTITTPNTDNDGNGTSDVVDTLSTLRVGGSTNYADGLETAEQIFLDLGTEPGNGNLIFISDGNNVSRQNDVPDIVDRLNAQQINLSAFGAGENSSLEDLQIIDSEAIKFTSTDQLLSVFGDLSNDADGDGVSDGGESQSTLEEIVPGITIYIDLNEDGMLDDDEPTRVTDDNGEYIFEGLAAGTYTLREVVPNGFTSTTGEIAITLGDDEAVENIDFGNISDEELAMLNVESDM